MSIIKTYNPLINPRTGDYVIEKGDTVQDFGLQFPAYLRLKVQKKAWMYAPDTKYGSDFSRIKKRQSNTPAILERIAESALAPLISDGRATRVTATSMPQAHNICNLEIEIAETKNTIQTFEFSPVG